MSSKMPARLRDGMTLTDPLPDEVWTPVSGLIPQPERDGKRKGAHVTVQDRDVIAALAAHKLLKVPWSCIPMPCRHSHA
jgi:hypothetical protein